MNKNSAEIQSFLETARTEAKTSGKQLNIPDFRQFRMKKYSADDTDFFSEAFLSDVAAYISHNQVSYYKELTSYKSRLSAVVLPVKKVIRKLVAFLFLPVVAEQNEINLTNARLFTHIRSYINRAEQNSSALLSGEMEQRLIAQSEQIARLSEQVEELSAKIAELEAGKGAQSK